MANYHQLEPGVCRSTVALTPISPKIKDHSPAPKSLYPHQSVVVRILLGSGITLLSAYKLETLSCTVPFSSLSLQ